MSLWLHHQMTAAPATGCGMAFTPPRAPLRPVPSGTVHAWFEAERGCLDTDILITIISETIAWSTVQPNRYLSWWARGKRRVLPIADRGQPAAAAAGDGSALCGWPLIVFLHPPYHLSLHCHPIKSVDARSVLCLQVSADLSSICKIIMSRNVSYQTIQ